MNPAIMSIDELIEALGLATYTSDKVKVAAVKLAIRNAYLEGKLEAIAESESRVPEADRPGLFTITERAKEVLSCPPAAPFVDEEVLLERKMYDSMSLANFPRINFVSPVESEEHS